MSSNWTLKIRNLFNLVSIWPNMYPIKSCISATYLHHKSHPQTQHLHIHKPKNHHLWSYRFLSYMDCLGLLKCIRPRPTKNLSTCNTKHDKHFITLSLNYLNLSVICKWNKRKRIIFVISFKKVYPQFVKIGNIKMGVRWHLATQKEHFIYKIGSGYMLGPPMNSQVAICQAPRYLTQEI